MMAPGPAAGPRGEEMRYLGLARGVFEATAWVDQPGTLSQQFRLEKN